VKSQSNHGLNDSGNSVTIDALPQEYRAVITVPYAKLRADFDAYWKVHELDLLRQYPVKGKKSKGGKIKNAQKIVESQTNFEGMYTEVLAEVIQTKIDKILFIKRLYLLKFDEAYTDAQVGAVFYYQVAPISVEDLDYECKNPVKLSEDEAFEEEKKSRKFEHVTYDSIETLAEAKDGAQALITIKALSEVNDEIKGKMEKEAEWVLISSLPFISPDVGMVVDMEYPLDGEEYAVQVSVQGARNLVFLSDAALAEKLEFASIEEHRVKFNEGFADYTDSAKEMFAREFLITQVLAKQMPLFPADWIAAHSKSLLGEYVKSYGGLDKVKAAMGVSTVDEAERICGQEIMQRASKDWALSCVAGKVDYSGFKFADLVTWVKAE